ncbi:MAG: uroporphyrinogen decarboxylase family protein [Mahellales bacterium]|jgi:uroporphyrinogen decarboxylase
MNSKARVKAAFSGEGYDRLPMWYGAEPGTTENTCKFMGVNSEEELMRTLGIDFRTIRPRYIGPHLERYPDGSFDTYWGIRRGGGFWGIPLNTPLQHAQSIKDVEKHKFPEVEWFDVEFNEEDKRLSKDYYIIGGMWAPFWHETGDLLGFEKMLVDLYLNPALVDAVIERTFQFNYEVTHKAFEANKGLIDMFWFANDFGSQDGLLLDPKLWRKFFKPRIKKLSELGHRYNMTVAMHSCGDIHEIIPDLIEIGIEVINPIQPTAANMDLATLKSEYGKDIIFFGAIDVTEILNHGTEQQVRDETRRVIDLLGYDGKYIVAPSHDLMMEEIPPRNIWAMYDEGKKYSLSLRSKQT